MYRGSFLRMWCNTPPWGIIILVGRWSNCRGLAQAALDTAEGCNGCCSFLPSFSISQQAHNRRIASASREPGSLPPPREARCVIPEDNQEGPSPVLPQPALLSHLQSIYAAWRWGRAPRKEDDLSQGRMLCAVISISLRRKLLISCPLTVEEIEIQRRCVP